MAKSDLERARSGRLKMLLSTRFHERGRFALLEAQSGIPLHRWKNFWYGKQVATADMVDFTLQQFANQKVWLETGREQSKAPQTVELLQQARAALQHVQAAAKSELKQADQKALRSILHSVEAFQELIDQRYAQS